MTSKRDSLHYRNIFFLGFDTNRMINILNPRILKQWFLPYLCYNKMEVVKILNECKLILDIGVYIFLKIFMDSFAFMTATSLT